MFTENKWQAANGQKLSEMEEDCTGSQGPHWTVVFEEEKENNKNIMTRFSKQTWRQWT